jgi:hypothetical protein
VKLGCIAAVVVLVLALADGRRRAQGTATCLPAAEEALPSEPADVLEVPPGLDAPPAELLLEELLSGLLESLEVVPPGVLALPVLLELAELRERIAKSTRPKPGLMITSVIVPTSVPELPATWAPVN